MQKPVPLLRKNRNRRVTVSSLCFGAFGVFLSFSAALGEEVEVNVGRAKQLFVDDHVVSTTTNVSREVGRATKHGVVLEPTLPSDFQSGVVQDGPDGGPGYEFGESTFCWFFSPHWDAGKKKFRLWYMASKREGSGLAYAESEDGIHWRKPMVAKDGKSNLVIVNPGGGLDGITVTIDPSLPFGHAEKYKAAYFSFGGEGNHGTRTRLDYSVDGINWKPYNNGRPVTGRAADFSNLITWDPHRKSPRWWKVRLSKVTRKASMPTAPNATQLLARR